MNNIIINADDFGKERVTSNAIGDLVKLGAISQTTMIVTLENYTYAKELCESEHFKDKVGLHVNLTVGMPLTEDIKKCSNFCGSDGRFNNFLFSKRARLFLTKKEKIAVAIELNAQMKKYVNDGFTLMHLDSHGHVHTCNSIYKIFSKCALKNGFKSIRLSINYPKSKNIIKRFLKHKINHYFSKKFVTTELFLDFKNANDTLIAKHHDIELMAHPHYTYDSNIIIDFDIDRALVFSNDYNLINYSELKKEQKHGK